MNTTNKQDKYSEGAYQRAVGQMVENEVKVCASTLIYHLHNTDEEFFDEFCGVLVEDDYIEPALYEADKMGREAVTEYAENVRGMAFYGDEPFEDLLDDETEAREFCEHFDIEPHQREALEHWVVSDWLADRLIERGEMVDKDVHGLTVWGRACSGQAILLDRVICDIYDELHGGV